MSYTALEARQASALVACEETHGAEAESILQAPEGTHMVFANEEHERFYRETLSMAGSQDSYHEALIYALGITRETRDHFGSIFDLRRNAIRTECLQEGWQTGTSRKAVRLAFNLYTGCEPSSDDFDNAEDQLTECGEYSVDDIFCCCLAPYFFEAVKIRYPEYFTTARCPDL